MPNSTERLKIGFVHRFDAQDIRSWSGIFYFMSQALKAHVGDVVYLGPDTSAGTKFIIDNTSRVNRFWLRLTGKMLATDHNRVLSRRLGRLFERRLRETPCDVIFAPVASVEIANMKTDVPIVYLSDITWADIVDYYAEYSRLSSFGRAEGERIESAAIRRASACVYPSQWSVNSARDHYGVAADAAFKVSFGANLAEPPSRKAALSRRLDSRINLLLVGVDWVRKGGPIAFECLRSLIDQGVDAQLTLVGCVPPAGFEHPNFRVVPFLNKHDPKQRKELAQLYLNAHFMLLPTRAEGLGVVTCEASSYGLPTIATDTGGVRGSLNEGVNGFVMPFEAEGKDFAAKILEVIASPGRYDALVISSRNEYERALNWDSWGRSIRTVMERVLDRKIEVVEPVSFLASDGELSELKQADRQANQHADQHADHQADPQLGPWRESAASSESPERENSLITASLQV